MTEERNFVGVVIASWLGASIAFGSCGSCNAKQELENKVDKRVIETQKNLTDRIHESESRVTTKIDEFYNVPFTVYKIEGKEYRCIPYEKQE